MRRSSWATSRIEMDDWNSVRSLHVDNIRVARWRMPAIGYGESPRIDRSAANKNPSSSTPTNNFSNAIFYFAFLTRFLYCSCKIIPPTAISFRGQLYSLFSFHSSFFSINSDADEFFPSSETGTRSTTIDEQDLLLTMLRTDHQLATTQSILREWNTATTPSALTREWSTRHENQPIERKGFSLLLYNISSLRMHLEDLIDYISESYPNIWALTGLHFNDDVNYQLASYFKSRYTIYYQHGSNGSGGVCLAIAWEVPHRIVSECNDINNLIAADVFNLNKKYTVAVVYSPPSEKVPIDILNRLHRYNRHLILVGDLNARHSSWHDLTSNSSGRRLAEWIDEKQNLRVFNTSQPTSIRSRAIIDLIVTPHRVSTESTVIDENMRVTDHYPVHWQISSFSQNRTTQEVKRIDWSVLQCTLALKQNFFFSLAQQMRQESIEFILTYEKCLVALKERCTSYHIVQFYRPSLPVYLVNLIKHRRKVLSSYRCSHSEDDRNLLRSMNSYIHREFNAVKRAQWQEFCLGLEPKNTHRFWNHCKNLFKKLEHRWSKDFEMTTIGRVLTDPNSMIEHAHRYYSHSFQRERNNLSKSICDWVQTNIVWATGRTSLASLLVQNRWSSSIYPSTEDQNIKWPWKSIE